MKKTKRMIMIPLMLFLLIFWGVLGHWLVGLFYALFFLLLLIIGLYFNQSPPQKFDERQLALRHFSYKLGLFVGGVLLYFGGYFFDEVPSFSFFILSGVGLVVFGYQALTGSLLGYNHYRRESLVLYLLFMIVGGLFFILYLYDFLIGSQAFITAGKLTTDKLFWPTFSVMIVGFCGLFQQIHEKN